MTPSERTIERCLWGAAWLAAIGLVVASVVYPGLPPRAALGAPLPEWCAWSASACDQVGVPYEIAFAPVRAEPLPPAAPVPVVPPRTRQLDHVGERFLARTEGETTPPPPLAVGPPTPTATADTTAEPERITRRYRLVGLYQDRPASPPRALVENEDGETQVLAPGDPCGRLRLVAADAHRAVFALPDGTQRTLACGETVSYEEDRP